MTASPTPWLRVANRWLLLLVALCLLCVTLAYQRSPAYQLDLTSPVDARLLEGFYPPGLTPSGPVRWTAGRGHVRLANLWPGQAGRLTLTLSAPRQDEPDPVKRGQPVAAEVIVNGQLLATLPMQAGPAEFTVDVPADVIGRGGSVLLTLQAPTFAPPNDLRPLALLVGGIRVTPSGRPAHLPPASPLLTLAVLVALTYAWLRRLGGDMGPGDSKSLQPLPGRPAPTETSLPPQALQRLLRFGTAEQLVFNPAALASLALIALSTVGLLLARPFVTPLANRLLLLLAVVCLGAELIRRLGDRGLDLRTYRAVAGLLVAAFAIRLALAHTPGDEANFIAFKMMLENVTARGVAAAYEIDPIIGAYPPLHHYLMALDGHLYRLLISPALDLASRQANFMMKMPTIILDMLIAVTIMVYALRLAGGRAEGRKRALAVTALYAFNPGIIYTTAYNGQLGDPLYSLFVAIGVAGLLGGQAATAGAGAALAVLTKPQASAFLPFLAVGMLRRLPKRDWLRAALAAGGVGLAVLAPFLLAGTVGHMLRTIATTVGHGPRIVSNAFNVWWLYGWGNAWEIKDTGLLLGPITFRAAGLALFFGVAYGLTLWALWRVNLTPDPSPDRKGTGGEVGDIAFLAGFVGLCFFMLPTEIHENYLFPTFPLLALAAAHDRRAWALSGVLAFTWFFNLVTTDVTLMTPLLAAFPTAAAAVFPFQVGLAALNVGVLLAWGYWVVRMGRAAQVSRPNRTVQ